MMPMHCWPGAWSALLFADDFNALSDIPQGLQKAVGVAYEWCTASGA
jgi:hypothetical protein